MLRNSLDPDPSSMNTGSETVLKISKNVNFSPFLCVFFMCAGLVGWLLSAQHDAALPRRHPHLLRPRPPLHSSFDPEPSTPYMTLFSRLSPLSTRSVPLTFFLILF